MSWQSSVTSLNGSATFRSNVNNSSLSKRFWNISEIHTVSDAVHIPRPRQIATSPLVSEGHLVQDVRLRTANLPKMVSDAAIVVEDIPPHEYVDASSKNEHVGAPKPTRSHGRPHATSD